jgi:hypothetical protein
MFDTYTFFRMFDTCTCASYKTSSWRSFTTLQIYSDNSLTLKLTNKTIELQVAPKTKSTPLWY